MDKRIPLGFGGLHAEVGDHIGHFFQSEQEWKAVIIPYFAAGLRRHEICVYVTSPDRHSESTIVAALRDQGIDADQCLSSGQLILAEGKATPEEMESWLDEVASKVPTEFELVRWGGDMTWSLRHMPSSQALMTWECTCNIKSVSAVYVCQYDLTQFLGDVTIDALKTHPLCIIGGTIHRNPFFVQPDTYLKGINAATELPRSAPSS